MKYLLDTNTCIRFINGRSSSIRARLLTIDDSEIAISTIVQAEMYAGSAKSQTPQRSREIQEEFFQRFVTIPFDARAARIYGDIRGYLERQGTPIGGNDLLIAATAIAYDFILVTHNTREFGRVVGLHIEDWETNSGTSTVE
ncbi:tRNA(fMet)-specific endonuclease VapC [Anaerolineae bacterium]|nr:tRNA(fMet)-specific endonuclease VapC [Anaerolineae bacterium]